MISVADAQQIVLERTPSPEPTTVPLSDALGCVLAEDIRADHDVPPFHRSAMDGYAVRSADTADTPIELEVVEEVQAGQVPKRRLGAGEATRIMTGAPLPEGADSVLQVELTEPAQAGRVRLNASVKPWQNVSPLGNEVRHGDLVLAHSRWIGPAEIGVLATFGYLRVPVYRRPTVAVMATGNELVDISEIPHPGQIRNSNESTLLAQLVRLGLQVDRLGVGRDDVEDLEIKIRRGMTSDFLFLTGGVSMGDYDFSKVVFRKLGVQVHFDRLRMKPAKPSVFGTAGNKVVFGLPGNPVSAFVAFENLGRPSLLRRMGVEPAACLPRRLQIPLAADYKYRSDRETFVSARMEWLEGGPVVRVLPMKGSADIVGFSRGNVMAVFPVGEKLYRAGETIAVQLMDDLQYR